MKTNLVDEVLMLFWTQCSASIYILYRNNAHQVWDESLHVLFCSVFMHPVSNEKYEMPNSEAKCKKKQHQKLFLSCISTSLVCKTQQKHKYLTTRLVLCQSLAHKFRLGVEMPLIFKLNSCITWWNHQLTVEYICAKNIFKLVYYNAKTSKVD